MIPTDLARTKVGYRDDEVALVIRLVFSRYGGDSCNLMIPLRDCSKASSISIIQLQYYGTVVRGENGFSALHATYRVVVSI